MKNIFCFVLLLPFFSLAQKAAKPDAYAKSITAADLKKHLYVIAGPEMEGRETATPGQRKAAAYIEDHFKSLGLQPGSGTSFQQLYNVYYDTLTASTLQVGNTTFELDKDYNAQPGNTASTLRFGEIVLLGSLSPDSLRNANLAGRLVVVKAAPAGNRMAAGNLYNLLMSKGVAAIITVSTNYPRPTPAARKSGLSVEAYKKMVGPQQFTVSESVARALVPAYDSAKNGTTAQTYRTQVLMEVQKKTIGAESSNVIGVLPGTDLKDEYLIITAHYDHLGVRDGAIYYGADDDGSGTVGVLEMAEAFTKARKEGRGPRRSIVFMTVSGEEKGLLGSEYYAAYPTVPLNKTTANLNIDMIGRSDSSRKGDTTNYIYVVGDDKVSSELKPISEAQNNKYTKLELDYKYNDPNDRNFIYYRSDHYNFAKNGVPIIFYYDGMLGADYHRPTDTPEKINYPLMAKRAQLIFYTAWEMANRNNMLKRDLPMPALLR